MSEWDDPDVVLLQQSIDTYQAASDRLSQDIEEYVRKLEIALVDKKPITETVVLKELVREVKHHGRHIYATANACVPPTGRK